MALKDFLQQVVNELVANGTLTDATLHLGTSPKSFKTTPPAIFWVPKSGVGSGPLIAMPAAVQAAYIVANPGKAIPRAIHARSVSIDVHLWAGDHAAGDDYSPTEALIDATLSAIHHQAYGCYRYIGEDWVSSGTDAMALGRRCVLSVEFFVPVLETTPAGSATTITSIPVTTKLGPIPPGGSIVTS